MVDRRVCSVAVIGDGPAGASLAAFLARGGARVGLFSGGRPPAPIVGESLLPAVIPILRELAIEDEVREYGEFKPGATFVLHDGSVIAFDFASNASRLPGYAYNVPRDRFDATLLAACRASGARVFPSRVRLERVPGTVDRLRIASPAPPSRRLAADGIVLLRWAPLRAGADEPAGTPRLGREHHQPARHQERVAYPHRRVDDRSLQPAPDGVPHPPRPTPR